MSIETHEFAAGKETLLVEHLRGLLFMGVQFTAAPAEPPNTGWVVSHPAKAPFDDAGAAA